MGCSQQCRHKDLVWSVWKYWSYDLIIICSWSNGCSSTPWCCIVSYSSSNNFGMDSVLLVVLRNNMLLMTMLKDYTLDKWNVRWEITMTQWVYSYWWIRYVIVIPQARVHCLKYMHKPEGCRPEGACVYFQAMHKYLWYKYYVPLIHV